MWSLAVRLEGADRLQNVYRHADAEPRQLAGTRANGPGANAQLAGEGVYAGGRRTWIKRPAETVPSLDSQSCPVNYRHGYAEHRRCDSERIGSQLFRVGGDAADSDLGKYDRRRE
ncbi:hypothetical protein D1872_251930 [compost metagenome]